MAVTRRDFVRTLFAASQVAVAGRLMTGSLEAAVASPGGLNFAVIGDWGRRGRPDQTQVAQQMAIACKNAAATFVVSLGDNFYDDGVADLQDPHWEQSYERVYSAESLQVPWYVILGNHDYRGNCNAQLQYAQMHPKWNMPARYYSKVYPIDAATNVECFYIDTTPFIRGYLKDKHMRDIAQQDTGKQFQWLDAALGDSKAQWKIVLGHHPVYSAGKYHGNEPDLIEMIQPLLVKHKIPAYFAGHDHDLQHLQVGDTNYFVSGGGSEHRDTGVSPESKFGKSASGFCMVAMTSKEMQVRFIDNLGAPLHSATIPRVS